MMQHLKNLELLFSKNFIESPLIDTYDAGNISITSGNLVASDPLTTSEMEPLSTKFPIGDFPVLIHKEIESNCIAYVEIIFKNEKPNSWQMATTKDQNISELKSDEIFGYPVESGMGCFMDLETQNELQKLELAIAEKKGEEFTGIYDEFFRPYFFETNGAENQYSFLKPSNTESGNIFAFETGYGDGFYASYIAYDAEKQPLKIISEFIEIES